MAVPVSVIAGPKEEAYQVVEKFKRAFDASDVQGIVNLFAPDAVFLGTVSPKLATRTDEINAYFQAIKTDTPRTVEIGDYSTLVLSDSVVVFAGMDQFSSTTDGKKIDLPARFTLVITKSEHGWRISHFHSSARPGGQHRLSDRFRTGTPNTHFRMENQVVRQAPACDIDRLEFSERYPV